MSLFEKPLAKLLVRLKLPYYMPGKLKSFPRNPKNFIVISNTALGDTVLSTPAIKSLKLSFPKTTITTILNPMYIKLLDRVYFIDKIIPYKCGYNGFFTALRKIKKISPEAIFIFHSNAPSDIELSILSGCKFILKYKTSHPLKKFITYYTPSKKMHAIENRLSLLKSIGAGKIIKEMEINPLDNTSIIKKIEDYLPAKKIVMLQIGSMHRDTRWPVENFTELAKKILNYDKTVYIILNGSKEEKALCENLDFSNRVINSCGKFSIEELPYLIKKSCLLITNDTGILHLAIALKVPTVSLFAASRASETGPYQDKYIHKVIQKDGSFILKIPRKKRDDSAMRLISVEEVYSAFKEAFNENCNV